MMTYECSGLISAYHLYYYFKHPQANDILNRRLVEFKQDHKEPLEIFSKLAAKAFIKKGLKFDFVTRVLGSDEVKPMANNRVIPVAKAVANATGAFYGPHLLGKTRETNSLKFMKLAQRRTELEGVYFANDGYQLNRQRVLIVDDISTTQTSFEFISQAIREKYPAARLYGFSLARTRSLEFDGIAANDPAWFIDYNAEIGK
jgi:predicted amidophosphoribosyltransferase